MYKHSNKAYVVGNGLGTFTWKDVAEVQSVVPESSNFVDPMPRDTFVTSPVEQAWTVIRYQVVNPGPYLLHCHTKTHLEGGMAIAITNGEDK